MLGLVVNTWDPSTQGQNQGGSRSGRLDNESYYQFPCKIALYSTTWWKTSSGITNQFWLVSFSNFSLPFLTLGGPFQQARQEPYPTRGRRGGAGWGKASETCHSYGGGSHRGGEAGRPRHLYGKPQPLRVPHTPSPPPPPLRSAPGWLLKSHCLKSDTYQNLGRGIQDHMDEAASTKRHAGPRWNLSGWHSGEWPSSGSDGFSGSDHVGFNFSAYFVVKTQYAQLHLRRERALS